jgi:hypothetical protein
MNTLLKRTLLTVGASVGLGLIFDLLFYDKLPGVSFPLYMGIVVGGIMVAARTYKVAMYRSTLYILLPLAFFSGMVFVRAGGFITFLNILASLYLLGLFLYAVFAPQVRNFVSQDYLAPVLKLPIHLARRARQTIVELSGVRSVARKHKSLPQVLRGVLITLPIVLLFGALMTSADLVFRKYMTDLFSFDLDSVMYFRLISIAAVSIIFVGVFGYLLRKPEDSKSGLEVEKPGLLASIFGKGKGGIEATILFGSLNALFLGFIIVQLTYLFGGEQNILAQGFTYAEYARKGFFELIAVAALLFALIVTTERALLQKGQQHSTQFKFLSAALILQVIVLMASAFKRLSLYESAYGFTSLRVLSHIFVVWLVIVFAILLYRIFVDQRESTFAFLSFLSVLALLAFINILNVDAFAARKNIDRYYRTGKIDVSYLARLSDDAILETSRLLDKPGAHHAELVSALTAKRHDLIQKEENWQSTNLARKTALEALHDRLSRQ